jgi:hypothetical protein
VGRCGSINAHSLSETTKRRADSESSAIEPPCSGTIARHLIGSNGVIRIGSKDQLIVDEPSFNYGRNGKHIDVVPMHMEYALTDLAGFSILTLASKGMLRVQMTNRLSNEHLKGREMDQLQWVCDWLSSSLHRAPPSRHGANENSFVYDQSGLHKK